MKLQLKLSEAEEMILRHVDTTADELFWQRIECGTEYLLFHYEGDMYEAFRDTPEFWQWWRQVWHQGDIQLLTVIGRLPEDFKMKAHVYYGNFNPENIKLKPNALILHEVFKKWENMIRDKKEKVTVIV